MQLLNMAMSSPWDLCRNISSVIFFRKSKFFEMRQQKKEIGSTKGRDRVGRDGDEISNNESSMIEARILIFSEYQSDPLYLFMIPDMAQQSTSLAEYILLVNVVLPTSV